MYSATIFSLLLCSVFFQRSFGRFRYSEFVTVCIYLLFLFAFFLIQTGLIVDLSNTTYFSLISSDSQRYIAEARLFSIPFFVNELDGTYYDGNYTYQATPKFGLSVYLAFFRLTGSSDLYFYAVMLVGSVILNTWKIRLIFRIFETQKKSLLFIAIVVFFPTDMYWNMRLLREPIANDLLELSLLLGIFILQGGDRRKEQFQLVLVIFLLIVWRPQLAIIACVAFTFMFGRSLASTTIFSILSLVALQQVIGASGRAFLTLYLGTSTIAEYLNNMLSILDKLDLNITRFSVLFVGLIIAKTVKMSGKGGNYLLALFIGVLIYIPTADEELQLRFIYPIFLYLKLLFLYLIVSSSSSFRLRKRRVRFVSPNKIKD